MLAVRPMVETDGPAVLEIYGQGIATGHATYESAVPTFEKWWTSRIDGTRLVATGEGGEVVGFAALSPVSARAVYRGVAEVTIYVAEAARGRGIGHGLLGALVAHAEGAGFWTLQAQVFPENSASITLHMAHGFREVGVRVRLARMAPAPLGGPMAGRWRDVVLLERRSETNGLESAN
ncbi:MAG: GNAT family N-acetyltransferase [Rhizobiales bacterium]|nr:GNAT family N-acetyltransferase [Hyphomicrobiales bacterium]